MTKMTQKDRIHLVNRKVDADSMLMLMTKTMIKTNFGHQELGWTQQMQKVTAKELLQLSMGMALANLELQDSTD